MADDTSTTESDATARVADDTTSTDQQATKPDVPPEVKRALTKANKEAEALRLKLKEYEDRDKTEAEKLTAARQDAEQRAHDAELRATRLEVAAEKGLTAAQAKRLVGTTREEFEADADEILRDFPVAATTTAPKALKPDLSQGARAETKASAVDRANQRLERLGIRKPTST